MTQWDFSSLGPFLFAGIMGLLTVTLVQIFLPFNANVDLAIAAFSVMLFSGFVLYDTQQIMKRLSPDEHILGECTPILVTRGTFTRLYPFSDLSAPLPLLRSG